MRTIDTAVTIAAPPHLVWDIVMDFPSYPEWNPFIISAAGEPTVGSTLTVEIRPVGDKASTHRPTVVLAEPGRRLQWLGALPGRILFSARHSFAVEPAGDGTLFRHSEEFRGLLVPLLSRTLDRTEEGFHAMNRALKDRAERLSAPGTPPAT